MAGKRIASTEGASSSSPSGTRTLLLLAVGITLAIVAWGYLVYAAIDFGASARTGNGMGWLLLLLASLGATACLFVGLMLISRITALLKLSSGGSGRPAKTARAPGASDESATGTVAQTDDDLTEWFHTRPTTGPRPSIVRSASGKPAATPPPSPSAPPPPEPIRPDEAPVKPSPSPAPRRGGSRRATEPVRFSRKDRPTGGRRAKR